MDILKDAFEEVSLSNDTYYTTKRSIDLVADVGLEDKGLNVGKDETERKDTMHRAAYEHFLAGCNIEKGTNDLATDTLRHICELEESSKACMTVNSAGPALATILKKILRPGASFSVMMYVFLCSMVCGHKNKLMIRWALERLSNLSRCYL